VLSKIDLPSKDVLANLRNLTEEVRTLGSTLREIKVESQVAQLEVVRLKEALTALNVSVDRLANTRTILTDEAIGQLGRAVTDTLTKMRGLRFQRLAKCSPISATTRPKPRAPSADHENGRMRITVAGAHSFRGYARYPVAVGPLRAIQDENPEIAAISNRIGVVEVHFTLRGR